MNFQSKFSRFAIVIAAIICGTAFGYSISELSGNKRTKDLENHGQPPKNENLSGRTGTRSESDPGTLVFRKKADLISEHDFRSIAERDIFSNYREETVLEEKSPVSKPEIKPFDIRPYCYLNAILTNEIGKEAWIDLRTEGKTLRLKEGDRFEIGGTSCIVIKIDESGLDVETGSDGILSRIDFGSSVSDVRHIASDGR